MNTYGRMKTWVEEVLAANNIERFSVHPGPEIPDEPDATITLTRYGGAGVILDGVMDLRFWQFRVVSKQRDYDSGETVADLLDNAMLSHHSRNVGGVWVSDIQRVGGAPSALMTDDGQRTHFVCSYNVSVELALAN
jgi:hypothetical protein